jgi:hypothetical protein
MKIDISKISSISEAEYILAAEFSNTESGKHLIFSEQMDYAQLIEKMERFKAKERMFSGDNDGSVNGIAQGKVRDIVGAKIGMSGSQYERAKYIVKHASPQIIGELDREERTVRGTYDELRIEAKSKKPHMPQKVHPPTLAEFEDMRAKKDEFVAKFSDSDHKREMLETELHNTNLQWQCERAGKNGRIAELTAKIKELESLHDDDIARILELEENLRQKAKETPGVTP